jgi:hypothetical protein
MSGTLARIRALISKGNVDVTLHGLRELAADDILLDDVMAGMDGAIAIEDYPAAQRGPSVLVLQRDRDDNPLHIVWGIPKGEDGPAVLITVYRPDPARWSADFKERRRQ